MAPPPQWYDVMSWLPANDREVIESKSKSHLELVPNTLNGGELRTGKKADRETSVTSSMGLIRSIGVIERPISDQFNSKPIKK